jgi:sugar (pentulose or hexulose) kinase
MVEEVMKADAQDESLLFFPFLAGERSPFWSDKISGSFEGLKLHHDKYHLTRAVMEGVAFSIRYILDLMEELNVEIIAAATGKKVVIYNAEETVTTVLYAIMASALRGESFRETLAALFTEPKAVRADDGGERYRRLYRNYRRFLGAKIQTYESMGSE